MFIIQGSVIFLTIIISFVSVYSLKDSPLKSGGKEQSSSESSLLASIPETSKHNYFTTDEAASQENEKSGVEVMGSPGHLYTVTIYDGGICAFGEGESRPCIKIFADLENMPEKDIEILEKGIFADSPAELIKILEDYD